MCEGDPVLRLKLSFVVYLLVVPRDVLILAPHIGNPIPIGRGRGEGDNDRIGIICAQSAIGRTLAWKILLKMQSPVDGPWSRSIDALRSPSSVVMEWEGLID